MPIYPITEADFITRHSLLVPPKYRTGSQAVQLQYICGFILGGAELFTGLQMSMAVDKTLLDTGSLLPADANALYAIANKYQHIWEHIAKSGDTCAKEPHSTANLIYTLVQYDIDFILNREPKFMLQVPLLNDKLTPSNRVFAMLILKKAAYNYSAYTPWYRTALVLTLLRDKSFELKFLMNIWQNTTHSQRNMRRMSTPGDVLYRPADAALGTRRSNRYESWKQWIRDLIQQIPLAANDITEFNNLQAMLGDLRLVLDTVSPILINEYRIEHLLPLIQNPAFQIALDIYKADKTGSLDMVLCDDLLKKYIWDQTDNDILDQASYAISHLHTIEKYRLEQLALGIVPTQDQYSEEITGLIGMLENIRMLVDPFIEYAYSIQITDRETQAALARSSSDLATLMFV